MFFTDLLDQIARRFDLSEFLHLLNAGTDSFKTMDAFVFIEHRMIPPRKEITACHAKHTPVSYTHLTLPTTPYV